MIEQATNLSEESLIDLSGLLMPGDGWCVEDDTPEPEAKSFQMSVADREKDLILDALTRANGNKAKAARLLNIQRSVLYKKMTRLHI
jgi:two-component system response regulator HydG